MHERFVCNLASRLAELLIVAFIVMLLFPKRVGSTMFNLGNSLKWFRQGLNEPACEQPERKEPAA
jgi:Sec-independent protein translocase protein TatA